MAAKFEISGDDREYRFRLKAGNGETVLVSQAYKSKQAAQGGIEAVRACATDESCYQRKKAKDGSRYFRLVSKNNRVVGVSEMYRSVTGVKTGIASVKSHASRAQIEFLPPPPFRPAKVNHARRIGNKAFVAPFAREDSARKLSGVIKFGAEQVQTYQAGQSSIAQVVLDLDAFVYDDKTLTADSILEALDQLRQLVEAHPHEVDQVFGTCAKNGGYVPEVRQLLSGLGIGTIGVEPIVGTMVLMASTASPMCASDAPVAPMPGDPDFPGDNDPGSSGGESPDDDDDDDDDEEDGSG